MNHAASDGQIDYVEFSAIDLQATKDFFGSVFGWKFEDYGPEYTSFHDGRLGGGFARKAATYGEGALVVIYVTALEEMLGKVRGAGGSIVKEIFPFPGGRRFHFTDPSGNELAVWSDK